MPLPRAGLRGSTPSPVGVGDPAPRRVRGSRGAAATPRGGASGGDAAGDPTRRRTLSRADHDGLGRRARPRTTAARGGRSDGSGFGNGGGDSVRGERPRQRHGLGSPDVTEDAASSDRHRHPVRFRTVPIAPPGRIRRVRLRVPGGGVPSWCSLPGVAALLGLGRPPGLPVRRGRAAGPGDGAGRRGGSASGVIRVFVVGIGRVRYHAPVATRPRSRRPLGCEAVLGGEASVPAKWWRRASRVYDEVWGVARPVPAGGRGAGVPTRRTGPVPALRSRAGEARGPGRGVHVRRRRHARAAAREVSGTRAAASGRAGTGSSRAPG
ncbi:hypothetical protein G443_002602 [Actinoalloteichus cyanogriseus DSM 43889]|uniref:Uncharacterized protein n=1 Tax=Actinoalloteichus caeruleus DSM 43889 TaxID=1120930 RepID=A0ABT1JIJ2_ACTCY|nr:hypothetical protein [Actinoalloteichus caeruleus DSM 43889]